MEKLNFGWRGSNGLRGYWGLGGAVAPPPMPLHPCLKC